MKLKVKFSQYSAVYAWINLNFFLSLSCFCVRKYDCKYEEIRQERSWCDNFVNLCRFWRYFERVSKWSKGFTDNFLWFCGSFVRHTHQKMHLGTKFWYKECLNDYFQHSSSLFIFALFADCFRFLCGCHFIKNS